MADVIDGIFDAVDAGLVERPTRRIAGLETIEVKDGDIDLTATAGEEALVASGLPVFRRDRNIVRPFSSEVPASRGRTALATGLDVVSEPGLVDLLNQAVGWCRYDGRLKAMRPIDPPAKVAKVILACAALSRLPSIAGVITTPTLRPDGSLLILPGYDEKTRLYHIVDPRLRLPQTTARPTRADANAAMDRLQGLLREFPFEGETDRAVALSAIVTAVVRGMVSAAPLHGFRASTPGSGKSYLVDLVSMICTGQPCPVMQHSTDDPRETDKQLVGNLLAGYPVISIDNVNGELGGDLLCQAIERPLIRLRPLGGSDIIQIENRALLLATGNNMRVRGDMTRRTLLSGLDAGVERPELKKFEYDPIAMVLADRGAYVSACLTIVRAYLAADCPDQPRPLASFGDWSGSVRGALLWLGCKDPVDSMEAAREDDPELTDLRDVLSSWKQALGINSSVTLSELDLESLHIEGLDFVHPDLRNILVRLAGDKSGINARRLGCWFRDKEGRIADGMRFKRDGKAHGNVQRWKLQRA